MGSPVPLPRCFSHHQLDPVGPSGQQLLSVHSEMSPQDHVWMNAPQRAVLCGESVEPGCFGSMSPGQAFKVSYNRSSRSILPFLLLGLCYMNSLIVLNFTMLSLAKETKISETMSPNSLFLKLSPLTGGGEGMMHVYMCCLGHSSPDTIHLFFRGRGTESLHWPGLDGPWVPGILLSPSHSRLQVPCQHSQLLFLYGLGALLNYGCKQFISWVIGLAQH